MSYFTYFWHKGKSLIVNFYKLRYIFPSSLYSVCHKSGAKKKCAKCRFDEFFFEDPGQFLLYFTFGQNLLEMEHLPYVDYNHYCASPMLCPPAVAHHDSNSPVDICRLSCQKTCGFRVCSSNFPAAQCASNSQFLMLQAICRSPTEPLTPTYFVQNLVRLIENFIEIGFLLSEKCITIN
jgi:hypothetical protein